MRGSHETDEIIRPRQGGLEPQDSSRAWEGVSIWQAEEEQPAGRRARSASQRARVGAWRPFAGSQGHGLVPGPLERGSRGRVWLRRSVSRGELDPGRKEGHRPANPAKGLPPLVSVPGSLCLPIEQR